LGTIGTRYPPDHAGGFTREEIARKLHQLADDDCWVDVAVNDSAEFSAETRALLHHDRINVDKALAGPRWMHAKYLLVEGNYDSTHDNKVVWMGSHNLTINALRSNDETLLKIDSNKVHDQFRKNFRKIMELSPDMW
jgi:phosphatidylserine/phosphatidylglycerophosphate/cardiolipin synthase-like enzyme